MSGFEFTIRVSDSGNPEVIEVLKKLVALAESGAATVTTRANPHAKDGSVSRESLIQYFEDTGRTESNSTSIAGRLWALLIKDPFADLGVTLDVQCIEHTTDSCACPTQENRRWQLSVAKLKEAQGLIGELDANGLGRALKAHLNGWIKQL